MPEFSIYSMFGRTVYSSDKLSELIDTFERQNTPASNAGVYHIIMTDDDDKQYVVRPIANGHTHGYHTFCAECHACGHSQREWCNGTCRRY